MIFSGQLYQAVLDGRKIVTRRKLRGGYLDVVEVNGVQVDCIRTASNKLQYARGKTYSVQPKRGVAGSARIEIRDITRSDEWGAIDDAEARREGFDDLPAFLTRWREIYGDIPPESPQIVRIEFQLVQDAHNE